MNAFIGTSGFAYKEWKGNFYPEKIKADEMLPFYANHFNSVEINNTFYKLPKKAMLETWTATVPDGFEFVIKASRRITHMARLKVESAKDPLDFLLNQTEVMGQKRGPIFFQLPPFLKRDTERLKRFLDLLPNDLPAAFEFRHESWWDEEVFAAFRSKGVAFCIADAEDGAVPVDMVHTAPYAYIRLRRPDYTDADLATWAQRITDEKWERAYVFFKHEEEGAGPALAARLRAALAG